MQIKKIIFGIVFFTVCTGFAQHGNHHKVKAYKTAYISEALDLTVEEAEKFWPIYKAYEKEYRTIKVFKTRELFKKIRTAGGVDKLSDADADVVLKEFLEIDVKVGEVKQKLKNDLKEILSTKKMIKLFNAEQNFNKELLKRFRHRTGNQKRN